MSQNMHIVSPINNILKIFLYKCDFVQECPGKTQRSAKACPISDHQMADGGLVTLTVLNHGSLGFFKSVTKLHEYTVMKINEHGWTGVCATVCEKACKICFFYMLRCVS